MLPASCPVFDPSIDAREYMASYLDQVPPGLSELCLALVYTFWNPDHGQQGIPVLREYLARHPCRSWFSALPAMVAEVVIDFLVWLLRKCTHSH